MTLSDLSIRKPVFAWILMFGLIFFGALSFQKMGINESPDVDYPTISIRYEYLGAAPGVIEKDVIEPVEGVLVTLDGVRNMSAVAQRGSANISLEFGLDRNIDFALQEVQTLLGRVQSRLPTAVEAPVVVKQNAADEPVLFMILKSDKASIENMRDLMVLFRDTVRDRFTTIDGVADLQAYGYHEPILRVDIKADEIKRYQLTPQDIVDGLQRGHSELPGGKFEYGDKEDLIRVMGEAETVKEFENIPITRRGGAPNFVKLSMGDVTRISESVENLRRISRFQGGLALAIAVQKQRGVNAVKVAEAVKARMEEVKKELPAGASLEINFDRSQFIKDTVDDLKFTLLLSALLTSLVCWLFLGSLASTVNILLAIPTAIVGTFWIVEKLGFTLNTFSMLGLSLAIGIVVDDAIIMLENIVRYMQMGYDRVQASFKGAREISFAVIATTATLVAIFIPITFLTGIEGRFFYEFAVTLCVAVSLSSLEALTLAPMRCSQFLTLNSSTSHFRRSFDSSIRWLESTYKQLLDSALDRKALISAVFVAGFGLSLLVGKKIGVEFEPAQDRGAIFVIMIAPDGKSLEYTYKKSLEFEEVVHKHPAVERIFTAVGGFGQGGQGNRGNGLIVLKDKRDRNLTQTQVADELSKEIKANISGIQIILIDRFGGAIGGRRGSPVEFTINGPDPKVQEEIYRKLAERMRGTELVAGFRSDDALQLPEIQILPNRERALDRGVEVSEIANAINIAFGGVVAGQYTSGVRRYDIQVQFQEKDRQSQSSIEKIFVRNNRGEVVRLSELVDVVATSGPQTIFREDRVRGLRVDSNLKEGVILSDAIASLESAVKEIFPEGYSIRFSERPDDKIFEILWIIALGLIVAYMVLAVQFNSFVDPLVIFVSVPFGVGGALLGLYLTSQTLNVYSAIGILLTIGIVKKNAILLVEFSNQLRSHKNSPLDSRGALLSACPTRLRPILMTTLATLAAALPAALATGSGSETRVPMAVTVLFGVSLSTLVTLFFVPIVYQWLTKNRSFKELVETSTRREF